MHYTTESLPAGTLIRLIIDEQETPCQRYGVHSDPLPMSLDAPWSVTRYTITYTDPAGGDHRLPARWVTLIWEPPCLTADVFTQQEGN